MTYSSAGSIPLLALLGLSLSISVNAVERPAVESQVAQFGPVAIETLAATTCYDDCVIEVILPEDTSAPPRATPELRFADSSQELTVEVQNDAGGNGATVLRFASDSTTPFANPDGQPMTTVPVGPGSNTLRVRPYSEDVCHAPAGCKYDVINTGQPSRPVLDPIIIIDPTM